MKCSVCGSDNLDGSAYCEDCGARLPVGAAVAAGDASSGGSSTPPPAAAPPPPGPPPPVASEPPPAAETPGTVVCASCGAENPGYEAYCEDCGASLSGAGSGGAAPSSEASTPVASPPPTPDAAPAGPARVRLSLADGSKDYPIAKDTIEIGRRSPVDGIYPDVDLTDVDTESFISRRHGRVIRAESGLLYEDLGSSNGSFLNDSRLAAGVQTALKDGDRLRLGKTEMVFRAS